MTSQGLTCTCSKVSALLSQASTVITRIFNMGMAVPIFNTKLIRLNFTYSYQITSVVSSSVTFMDQPGPLGPVHNAEGECR